jgi:hypothetical protein
LFGIGVVNTIMSTHACSARKRTRGPYPRLTNQLENLVFLDNNILSLINFKFTTFKTDTVTGETANVPNDMTSSPAISDEHKLVDWQYILANCTAP